MTTTSSSRCDACGANVGPWQATIAITSECAHTFNLRFATGSAACQACAAALKDAPATAAAPPPATAFGSPSTAASTSSLTTPGGVFGQRQQASSNFLRAQPPSSQPFETSIFGRQQSPPATPKPNTFAFGLASASPAAQPSSSPCSACGVAMGRGEATVTSECAHKFHLRCFSGNVCPACSARWRYEVTVKPSSSSNPFFSSPQPFMFSQSAGSTSAPPNPSSTPSCFAQPSSSSSSPQPSLFPQTFTTTSNLSSAPPMPSLFSRSGGSTFAPASTLSTPTPAWTSMFSQPTASNFAPSNPSPSPHYSPYSFFRTSAFS